MGSLPTGCHLVVGFWGLLSLSLLWVFLLLSAFVCARLVRASLFSVSIICIYSFIFFSFFYFILYNLFLICFSSYMFLFPFSSAIYCVDTCACLKPE